MTVTSGSQTHVRRRAQRLLTEVRVRTQVHLQRNVCASVLHHTVECGHVRFHNSACRNALYLRDLPFYHSDITPDRQDSDFTRTTETQLQKLGTRDQVASPAGVVW